MVLKGKSIPSVGMSLSRSGIGKVAECSLDTVREDDALPLDRRLLPVVELDIPPFDELGSTTGCEETTRMKQIIKLRNRDEARSEFMVILRNEKKADESEESESVFRVFCRGNNLMYTAFQSVPVPVRSELNRDETCGGKSTAINRAENTYTIDD